MNFQKNISLSLLLFLFFLIGNAQEITETDPTISSYNIRITQIYIDKDDEKLKIRLNGLNDKNEPFLARDIRKYVIEEVRKDEVGKVEIIKADLPTHNIPGENSSISSKNSAGLTNAVFMLDASGSMKDRYDNKISKARDAINSILQKYSFDKKYLVTFNETISEPELITSANAMEKLMVVNPNGGTALYEAIIKTSKTVKDYSGRTFIFIVSDGSDDRETYSQFEVLQELRALNQDIWVYTIGLHYPDAWQFTNPWLYEVDEDFLKKVSEATGNPNDHYIPSGSSDELSLALESTVGETQDHLELTCNTPFPLYSGIKRNIRISYLEDDKELASTERTYFYGSPFDKIEISANTYTNLWRVFIFGAILSILMLVGFAIGLPIVHRRQFKEKYVKSFKDIDTGRLRPLNPTTDEPFSDHDQVVTKCKHLMTYDDWKAFGNKCLEYPSHCEEGVDHLSNSRFFNQQGLYKLLNWLWFGAVGALFAWGASEILQANGYGFRSILNSFSFINDVDKEINYVDPVYRTSLTGLAIGFFLTLSLTLVEEIGQSRKLSWGRITLRTCLGVLSCFFIFFISSILFVKVINVEYWGELILWVLCGTTLGAILSINSSIETITGLKAGLIASLIAFHLNYLISKLLFSSTPEYGDLIGIMCYGAILGSTIFSVVSQLEDFHLEYLSPTDFRGRTNPISKWLKSGLSIYMGTEDGCHVFVKWDDPLVKGKHAKLAYNSGEGVVSITPIGDTFINGRRIRNESRLFNGDEIRLGEGSKTIMRYHEKRTEGEVVKIETKSDYTGSINIKGIRRKNQP